MNKKLVFVIKVTSCACGAAGGLSLINNLALGVALIALGASIMALGYLYLVVKKLSL